MTCYRVMWIMDKERNLWPVNKNKNSWLKTCMEIIPQLRAKKINKLHLRILRFGLNIH